MSMCRRLMLVIASKVPGAWLVQIKDAGHAVVDQYPDEVGKILQTFLSTTTPHLANVGIMLE
jgi:pimeloyl-ACP methyl ester carboxylesterase